MAQITRADKTDKCVNEFRVYKQVAARNHQFTDHGLDRAHQTATMNHSCHLGLIFMGSNPSAPDPGHMLGTPSANEALSLLTEAPVISM